MQIVKCGQRRGLFGPVIQAVILAWNRRISRAMNSPWHGGFWRLALIAAGLMLVMAPVNAQPIILSAIPVSKSLGNIAVNSALNRIYLSGQGMQPVEIDGSSFKASPFGAVGDAVDVDPANDSVWQAGLYAGTAMVWRSNGAAARTLSLGECPTGVNIDGPHRLAWVAAQCGERNDPIWAVNADTCTIIAGPIGSGGVQGATQVNPATGRFYISPDGVSKRVNPSTFVLTLNKFGTVLGVNASANLLYAASNSTTLQIIDGAPDPEVVLTIITLPFNFGGLIGVNPILNRIYVGSSSSNLIAVCDGRSGKTIETITLGSSVTSVGNIAVDAGRSRVYALACGAGSAELYVIGDAPAEPVVITSEPVNTTASQGGKATLSVAASGYPLHYQWAFNGTNIAGTTNSTLTLSHLSADNAGLYTVTVENTLGSVTTPVVSLGLMAVQMYAGVVLDGPSGAKYSIQAAPVVNPASWITLTNVTLGTQPFIYIDYSSPTNSKQFYRAVPLAP
jgi:Immunoglobulin domain